MPDTRENLPPGPSWPPLAQTLAWGLRPLAFSEWCARRYGTPYTMRMLGGPPLIEFADPAAVREIFALEASDFSATETTRDFLEPFLGPNSLLMLDGERHRQERRVVVRALHAGSLAVQEQTIAECTHRAMNTWPRDRSFPMHPAMQALTLEVIVRAAFGVDDDDTLDRLLGALREFLALAGSLLILFPPFRERWFARRKWQRFNELRSDIDRALIDLIRDRRSAFDDSDPHDILTRLAMATDDTGSLLDEDAVRDHLLTLLLAGHDTTATALGWAFDLLAHTPSVAERLARELEDNNDIYLDAVIKEVLRTRPVIPEIARVLTRPVTVGGLCLPVGHAVAANIHLAHLQSETYPDPRAFRPERFLDAKVDVHAWIPFGGGIRRCIGAAFATLEMRTVLRTVVPELLIRPARKRPEAPRRRAVTLIPRHGAPVVLSPRAATRPPDESEPPSAPARTSQAARTPVCRP